VATTYRVRIVDQEAWEDWRAIPHVETSEAFFAAIVRRIGQTGETALRWQDGGYPGFTWSCPGCGHTYWGALGGQPVSGWDRPMWVNRGTREAPTLEPSLGCPRWRDGTCPSGHWWLRDGELIPA
jgi:hypothetical protein